MQIDEVGSDEEPNEPPEDQVYRQQRRAVRDSLRAAADPDDQSLTREEFHELQDALKASRMSRKRRWLAEVMNCAEDEVGEVSDDNEPEERRAEKHRKRHTRA